MAITLPTGQRSPMRPTNPTTLFSVAAGAAAAWVLYRWYSPPKPDQEGLPFPYEDAERDVQRKAETSKSPSGAAKNTQ
ncbi:hypothetical protein EYZ11_006681 [Aspergillus tanneri]|uniref:Uncharacterized protein n=1 Tax=Aspergillus tanneri TaxID=1220188 RepID=A0A4S3JEU8_9EURO|nr:uncharacterized protein ATNIH1004_009387 [Aspergillus tanneri]KAA8645170.1 hypothetical protein ATNIH1004_009387 [Aspergillus tanneri]THC93829.1 hypothetical protein EYZ11_006681 [Aspergillus tanneri]